MNSWFVYWFIVVGKLSGFFWVGAILVSVIWITWFMVSAINEEELNSKFVKKHLCRIWIPILLFLLAILTPNLKEMAAIYLIPKVVNNEQVQQIPQKGLELLELQLNKWIEGVRRQ